MQRQWCVLCDEIFDDEGEETDISCDGCAQAHGLDRAPQAHSGCFVKYNRVDEIWQSADGIIDWWCEACIPTVEPAAPIAAAPAPLTQDERDEFERLQDLTRDQSLFIDRLQTQIEGQAAVTSPPAAPPVPMSPPRPRPRWPAGVGRDARAADAEADSGPSNFQGQKSPGVF